MTMELEVNRGITREQNSIIQSSMATKDNGEEVRDNNNSSWVLEDRHLPNDVALHIASMLQVPELCALGSSSVFWRHLCASDLVWVSLARKRWPCLDLQGSNKEEISKMCENAESSGHSKLAVSSQGWRAFYIKLHAEMTERAHSVIELVKQSAQYESLEVGDYQRAMEHLHKTKMGFEDVQLYLLTTKRSVLVNLIGLHYCLAWLGIQSEYVKEALGKNQIADRHICLRWWSLGQWVNGFRRGDEMHVCIAPLTKLLESKQEQFLYVIQRGAMHEVLRVQISADFNTSAWIARDMIYLR